MESMNDPERKGFSQLSLTDTTELGSLNAVYKTLFNPGVVCLRSLWLSGCTMQEGLLCTFLILALATLLLLLNLRFMKKSEKNRLPTPPGSKGWPLFGETYSYFHMEDTAEFVRRRVKKYGEIFYTHILGGPHIMVHTPEFLRFMLADPHHLLRADPPFYAQRLFRTGALFGQEGKVHSSAYALILKSMSTKYHEDWIVGFSDVMRRAVESWKGRTINCHHESQMMFIDTGFVYIFGTVSSDKELREKISQDEQEITRGLVRIPINIPGTGFGRALQARKNLDQLMARQLEQHLKMREGGVKPQFYSVMEFFLDNRAQTGKELNSQDCIQTISDLVTAFLFGNFETIAHLFTWIIKFLSENHEVLQRVKAEQDVIRSSKEGSEYTLTGEDLAKMTYSWQVIQETMRLASVSGTILRKAKTDFEYKGFTIPKGWTLHAGLRSLHYNPDYFPNPAKFDPSRFQYPANIIPDTFCPFGFGNRGCLGKTLVKIQILVVLHYVSTRLRWSALDSAAPIAYNPQAHIKGGYPIQVDAN